MQVAQITAAVQSALASGVLGKKVSFLRQHSCWIRSLGSELLRSSSSKQTLKSVGSEVAPCIVLCLLKGPSHDPVRCVCKIGDSGTECPLL